MRHRSLRPWIASGLATLALAAVLPAQEVRVPTARVTNAPRLTLPGRVDSNNPLVWHSDGPTRILTAITSWGGVPELSRGASVDTLGIEGGVTFTTHPGHGVWFEALVVDDQDRWYGFYHHERPADECQRPDRQLPRIGAARSTDFGRTWDDLGIVLDAPPGSSACDSTNRFVLGGVGDVTAALDRDQQFLYLYFSQYGRDATTQGVAAARLAWADRDAPAGRVEVWNEDVWLPASNVAVEGEDARWEYPVGTSLQPPSRPFHDGQSPADVFWGPAIHWNTHLEQYVMLLNRAKDEQFGQDGIYVSYAPTLDAPRAWSLPVKVLNGGGWYPQVAGLDAGLGTDKLAGARARLFLTGSSSHYIEFER
jgi:hypothetical protein